MNISLLKPLFQKDLFALKNLEAPVHWSGWEAVAGIFLILISGFGFRISDSLEMPRNTKHETRNPKLLRGYFFLFLTTAIFVQLVLFLFINKIEGYSQNAAIEFYESKSHEDCYVSTYGYKSYAHIFYALKRQPTNPKHANNDWLMRGEIDKPTYWVAKYTAKAQLDTVSTLKYLYDKNGFVFYQRK